jgi:flagellar basal body-associated protein FliL
MSAKEETEAKKEETPAAATDAAAGGKGVSPTVLIGIAAGFMMLMMGGGFALAFFVLPGQIAKAINGPPTEHHATVDAHGSEKKDDAHGEKKTEEKKDDAHGAEKKDDHAKKEDDKHGEKKDAHGAEKDPHGVETRSAGTAVSHFSVQEILVNVSGSRGSRFVKVSLSFDAAKSVLSELEAKRPMVIDLVSQSMGSKSMEELTAPTARSTLRNELITLVNATLKEGQVANIYFTEFIIQ